jgi:hypothetical protein
MHRQHQENLMSKHGFLITAGGMATAMAAHALFFLALIAAQPTPAQYLAQLAAPQRQTIESPQWLLAAYGAQPEATAPAQQIVVEQPASPEYLHKGLTTC